MIWSHDNSVRTVVWGNIVIRTPTIYFDIFAKQKGEEKLGESNIDIYTYILSCWLQNNKIYKITKSCVQVTLA